MPSLPSPAPSGDSAGPLAADPPLPPGQLVATEVILASDLPPGPRLPLFADRVPAGFPSPADDYIEGRFDLHELVGAGSPSCFFLRVSGESMTGAGIFDGDVLIVDRALAPTNGCVVIASVDGDLTVKRYVVRAGRTMLLAANPQYPPIQLQGEQELIVWGVVTHSFHDHRIRRPPGTP